MAKPSPRAPPVTLEFSQLPVGQDSIQTILTRILCQLNQTLGNDSGDWNLANWVAAETELRVRLHSEQLKGVSMWKSGIEEI